MNPPRIDLDGETITQLQQRMAAGEINSRELTEHCLARISALDGKVNAILELNPEALIIADALDAERLSIGPRGLLHGLPILVKDNIDTADQMLTTAGSLALVGHHATHDAHVVTKLREAGAVLLGKTNLSEWANFRSARSSSGWSSRGGQTRNPYALDRTPGGSSSGSAVAVACGFCVAAIGTETDGSIVGPAAMASIVGIKPSLGRVGRSGIIPIAHSQDTAGPMARNVADALIVLQAISGPDPLDEITNLGDEQAADDFLAALNPGALRGARIGVARNYCGFNDAVDELVQKCLTVMREAGATIVEDLELTSVEDIRPSELQVMMTEFKAGLNDYLADVESELPVHSITDLIAFNIENQAVAMPYFGQDIIEKSERMGPPTGPGYLDALATSKRLSQTEGIDKLVSEHNLDALVAPTTCAPWLIDWINGDNRTGGSACLAAVSGYPSITVPAGYVFGLPIGLSFFSTAFLETRLGALANAFQQQRPVRTPPTFADGFRPSESGMEGMDRRDATYDGFMRR
ncbi:MAG: amidase [Proteobacteria bacterium]|nr:amidase [Pseudomonadota bacterium]